MKYSLTFLLSIFSLAFTVFLIGNSACKCQQNHEEPVQLSGIYPHLAMYADTRECGIGAVVPWADQLWTITYGPHFPFGSESNKLYSIHLI